MSNGLVTQIIGAVIDVEFEKNNIPQVYEAIKITDTGTVLEVQQQLGDGIVRAIAMGTTEGLKRGLTAERTNAPISVPVGEKTLGRIMDVLGNPIDECGPIGAEEQMPPKTFRVSSMSVLASLVMQPRDDNEVARQEGHKRGGSSDNEGNFIRQPTNNRNHLAGRKGR